MISDYSDDCRKLGTSARSYRLNATALGFGHSACSACDRSEAFSKRPRCQFESIDCTLLASGYSNMAFQGSYALGIDASLFAVWSSMRAATQAEQRICMHSCGAVHCKVFKSINFRHLLYGGAIHISSKILSRHGLAPSLTIRASTTPPFTASNGS
jgi:hypothetical protein